jgi:hypothetical protein
LQREKLGQEKKESSSKKCKQPFLCIAPRCSAWDSAKNSLAAIVGLSCPSFARKNGPNG